MKIIQLGPCEACRGHGIGIYTDSYGSYEEACPVCLGAGTMHEYSDYSDPNELLKEICDDSKKSKETC